MTSALHQSARYALWNHPSQFVTYPIEWRTTPKSRKQVAVAASRLLPGTVTVTSTANGTLRVDISETQQSGLEHWLSQLPDHVMPATATELGFMEQPISSVVFVNSLYQRTCNCPADGQRVFARVNACVVATGPLRKAQVCVTDVYTPDVFTG
jgi:hypothetical protein